MIKADRHTEEYTRASLALSMLETSGYSEPEQDYLSEQILNGSADEIEQIIEKLSMDYVDQWNSFRQKDIQYRLNRHEI